MQGAEIKSVMSIPQVADLLGVVPQDIETITKTDSKGYKLFIRVKGIALQTVRNAVDMIENPPQLSLAQIHNNGRGLEEMFHQNARDRRKAMLEERSIEQNMARALLAE